MKSKITTILFLFLVYTNLSAQVKIGGTGSPHANSVLELDGGSNKGLLLPRLTDAQMNAMNNVPDGMMVYNINLGKIYIRRFATWEVAGGITLPHDKPYAVDNNYVLRLFNTSSTNNNGAISGMSHYGHGVFGWSNNQTGIWGASVEGVGVYAYSDSGTGLHASSATGPALTTASGNVGIGLMNPAASLHVKKQTQTLFILENSYPLGVNVRNDMQFKTGNYFTGVISTIGTSAQNARLGFHTGAHTTAGFLPERMTIANNGNVGINNNVPSAKLDVVGTSEFNSAVSGEPSLVSTGEAIFNQPVGNEAAINIKGRIKMSGANPRAFIATVSVASGVIALDHPDINNNPNAIILITQRDNGVPVFKGQYYLQYWLGTWYIYATGYVFESIHYGVDIGGCYNECWENINVPSVSSNLLKFDVGQQFNVLVIGN